MIDLAGLYERDFAAWTRAQADALRAALRTGSNLPLDWHHLAEEVEGLANSQRTALRSQVTRIIRHLLKLEFSPAREPRRGWRESVRDARYEIELILSSSPSLRPELETIVSEQTPRALSFAADDLDEFGELTASLLAAMKDRFFTAAQVVESWYPTDREV